MILDTSHAILAMQRTRQLLKGTKMATTTTTTTTTLPEKPSELIRLALKDLATCEASPKYRIHMDAWHQPSEKDEKCLVCLAGAIMAQTLESDPKTDLPPGHFGLRIWLAMQALDCFRTGAVGEGLDHLDYRRPLDVPSDWHIPKYRDSPEQFKGKLRVLADKLGGHGL